jgi:hypothetical protein
MQWLLTAVILGAACWMVSALTYEDEAAASAPSRLLDAGRESLPRLSAAGRTTLLRWARAIRTGFLQLLRAAGPALLVAARVAATVTITTIRTVGSAVWWVLRTVGIALGRAGRAAGVTTARTWTATRDRAAAREQARMEQRRLAQTAKRYRVPFEKSLILTGPQDTTAAAGVSLPAFSASSGRPSALSRLLAFIQLMFLVVLWGSGAALAIAGAAWAVTRIV